MRMVDTSIKNTGNSRSLRTVANALTLYPTHEAMIAAMVNGTFPIDIGPLNAAGLNIRGTDLNKASLLSDETAALFGLTGNNATVDQALKMARPIATGYYVGTGQASQKISLPFTPSAVLLLLKGQDITRIYDSVEYFYGGLAVGEKDLIYGNSMVIKLVQNGFNVYKNLSASSYKVNTNANGSTYHFIAFG